MINDIMVYRVVCAMGMLLPNQKMSTRWYPGR